MDSFDFNSLDENALEQTLAYFKPNTVPEPIGDEFTSYSAMVDNALEEQDWLEDMQEEATGKEMAGSGKADSSQFPNASNDMLASKVKKLSCTWIGCEESFSQPDLAAHLTGHAKTAKQQFHAPSSCVWSGCSSKVTFKYLYTYGNHLANIHVEPLICKAPNCSYRKPFRDQDDLDRHSAVSHSEIKNYHCPYGSCDAETKKFARRDKWVKHIQETIHENDVFCPYYHCVIEQGQTGGFGDRKQISRHFSSTHARNVDESFACALGSCANAPFSTHWSDGGLAKHLGQDHGYNFGQRAALRVVQRLRRQERVLSAKHLGLKEYQDCRLCSARGTQQTTQATTSTAAGYQPLPRFQENASTMT